MKNSTLPFQGTSWVGIVTFLSGVGVLKAEWSPQVVTGIQYLTSDETLLPLVRGCGLVARLEVSSEAQALARLRTMIDITESADGKALEVGVFSGLAGLDAFLTNAVAESGTAMPEAELPRSSEKLVYELALQEVRVSETRAEMLRMMQATGVTDISWMWEGKDSEDEIAEISSEPAALAEWENVEEARRRKWAIIWQAAKAGEQQETKGPDGVVQDTVIQAATSLAPIPPEFERGCRVYKQQLAVLNHLRFLRIEALHREERKSEPLKLPTVYSSSGNDEGAMQKEIATALKIAPGQREGGILWVSGPWRNARLILLVLLLVASRWLFHCWRRRNSGLW